MSFRELTRRHLYRPMPDRHKLRRIEELVRPLDPRAARLCRLNDDDAKFIHPQLRAVDLVAFERAGLLRVVLVRREGVIPDHEDEFERLVGPHEAFQRIIELAMYYRFPVEPGVGQRIVDQLVVDGKIKPPAPDEDAAG